MWITAQYQDPPPAAGEPRLPEPPDPSRVDHRSYAFQWFGLALVPLVGWPIVLARHRRRGAARRPRAGAGPAAGDEPAPHPDASQPVAPGGLA
ncbi:MAG: hypothetical protein KatS3mg009_2859 [Acidimicrobiia bacterium]|nr:MAG: hypothetical protein KatS3mg009_2859 [Acidimicrobiia bacterium]